MQSVGCLVNRPEMLCDGGALYPLVRWPWRATVAGDEIAWYPRSTARTDGVRML